VARGALSRAGDAGGCRPPVDVAANRTPARRGRRRVRLELHCGHRCGERRGVAVQRGLSV